MPPQPVFGWILLLGIVLFFARECSHLSLGTHSEFVLSATCQFWGWRSLWYLLLSTSWQRSRLVQLPSSKILWILCTSTSLGILPILESQKCNSGIIRHNTCTDCTYPAPALITLSFYHSVVARADHFYKELCCLSFQWLYKKNQFCHLRTVRPTCQPA